MKRLVLRGAVVPSCATMLILVAAACGGTGAEGLFDPVPDAGTTPTTASSGGSSGSTTSSSSGSTSGSASSASSTGGSSSSSSSASSASSSASSSSTSGDGGTDGGTDSGTDAGVTLGTYVSEQLGKAGNPGTKLAPVATIAEGIANAVKLGGAQTVFVAQGHYPEKVTLVEGVSLLGGHQCTTAACTWTHDPSLYDSSIDAQDTQGVLANNTITRKTKLQGFRLRGKNGSANGGTATGLTVDGGSPTITGNVLVPGAITGGTGRAAGLVVQGPTNDPAGVLVDLNRISGGSASNVWFGISLERKPGGGATAIATITRNTITGGSGATSLGIGATSAAAGTVIQDNDIQTGNSTGAGGSWGIQVSSTLTIDRNRINVDTATAGTCAASALCGGISSQSSTTTMTNNVVFGGRSARSTAVLLAEAEGPPGPVVLNGNYLDGAGLAQLGASGTTISTAVWLRICQGNGCGMNAILGRLRNNVFLGGRNENRYGIYEDQIANRTAHPDKLDSDDFFFAPLAGRKDVAYHFWNGTAATDYATIADIVTGAPTTPAPSALLSLDPAVDTTFHLPNGSGLIDKGTPTDAPATDFDGEKRNQGNGVDIGPDEAN